jgi:hypothetical protein
MGGHCTCLSTSAVTLYEGAMLTAGLISFWTSSWAVQERGGVVIIPVHVCAYADSENRFFHPCKYARHSALLVLICVRTVPRHRSTGGNSSAYLPMSLQRGDLHVLRRRRLATLLFGILLRYAEVVVPKFAQGRHS